MTEDKTTYEIRALLERWYSGVTAPEETARLMELLRRAEDLPADLYADRDLLLSLCEASLDTAPMSEECSRRIDAALDREMRLSASAGRSRIFRRSLYAAASVAACALVVFTAVRLWNAGDDGSLQIPVATSGGTLANAVVPESPSEIPGAAADTIRLAVVPKGAPASGRRASSTVLRTPQPEAGKENMPEVVPETVKLEDPEPLLFADASDFLTEEECRLYANYRIVENEAEAASIIGGVMAGLDSRIAEESASIDNIIEDYNACLGKLYY